MRPLVQATQTRLTLLLPFPHKPQPLRSKASLALPPCLVSPSSHIYPSNSSPSSSPIHIELSKHHPLTVWLFVTNGILIFFLFLWWDHDDEQQWLKSPSLKYSRRASLRFVMGHCDGGLGLVSVPWSVAGWSPPESPRRSSTAPCRHRWGCRQ